MQSLEKSRSGYWQPPRRYKPSEWAERNFVLPSKGNAEGGPFRFVRTPYLREIVDAIVEPGIEDVVFMKPTRVGGTTAGQIILGYWIDNDPGNCLSVMPSEAAAQEEVKDHIRPLLEIDALKQHLSGNPHDNTLSRIVLDTMDIYMGWAGSPQSLAAKTCRYVRFDETDKYPPFAGRESDPISLGKERTGTYGFRKRHYITSTPTTRDGTIAVHFEGCGDKRYFFVPCPHCAKYQRLAWPQVKWPKKLTGNDGLEITDKSVLADKIEQNGLAWYECALCQGRIEMSHKPKMLERGVWAQTAQVVNDDGSVSGERQHSKRVGFHLSSLYSPWRTFAEMASEFIRAEGDIKLTMNFRNSRLAEPFEVQISKREPHAIREKAAQAKSLGIAGQQRVVPSWAVMLLATCDVQKDHCFWSVSAWGYDLKSKRICVGIGLTLDSVYQSVFHPDVPFTSESGVQTQVAILIVDSGFRKDEVTEFARRDPTRVHMSKGLSTYFGPIAEQKVEKASGVVVWNINTMQSKDTLDRLIGDPDPLRWQVYADISDGFCTQVTSEHKILDPQNKRMEWKQKTSGADNHWWDCEAMAVAVASAMGAAMAKPNDPPPATGNPVPSPRGPESPSWIPARPIAADWMNR